MHAALISRAPHPRLACYPPCPAAGRALYSSKGYAVGIKAQKWMLAEEHVKTDELSDELGSTQQPRRRRHDLVRQPGLGFRRHGPRGAASRPTSGTTSPPRTWARTSSRPSGRQRWRRLQAAAEAEEEADLFELEAADAVAGDGGVVCSSFVLAAGRGVFFFFFFRTFFVITFDPVRIKAYLRADS